MSEVFSFDERKRAVVDENTALSLMAGLAISYHKGLKAKVDTTQRISLITDDPVASILEVHTTEMQMALTAEVPIAFSLHPSNMAVSVNAIKVDPNTGAVLPFSVVRVGIVGGFAADGQPGEYFTEEDLSLAVQRLRVQKQAGLVYGLQDGSGFLSDY